MKIQLTASMAVLLLALIGPNGTLGVPIEQQAGKEDSKSIESNDVFWIPPPGAHYGPIAARGADESTFPPNFPMGGGGWEIVHHKRMYNLSNYDVHGNFSLFELKVLTLTCPR